MKITIHKSDDNKLGKLSQPICGAYLFPMDKDHFLSVRDSTVTCKDCLKAIEERKHLKNGRLVF